MNCKHCVRVMKSFAVLHRSRLHSYRQPQHVGALPSIPLLASLGASQQLPLPLKWSCRRAAWPSSVSMAQAQGGVASAATSKPPGPKRGWRASCVGGTQPHMTGDWLTSDLACTLDVTYHTHSKPSRQASSPWERAQATMRSWSSSSRFWILATSWNLAWLYFLYTDTREEAGALRASAASASATGRSASSVKPEYLCRPCGTGSRGQLRVRVHV